MTKKRIDRRSSRVPPLAVAVWLAVIAAAPAGAQPTVRDLLEKATGTAPEQAAESSPAPAPSPAAEAAPPDELKRGTPRGAMEGFLAAAREGDYKRAAEYLDLSQIRPAERAKVGPQLARYLRVILDRTVWIDTASLNATPEGWAEDGLPSSRDRVARITTDDDHKLDVQLAHVVRDGVPIWLISRDTLAKVPEVYEEFGYGALGEVLPTTFLEFEVAGVPVWYPVVVLAGVIAAYLLGWVASLAVGWLLRGVWRRRGRRAAKFLVGPFHLAIAVSIFSGLTRFMPLALRTRVVLGGVETALLIAAFTWVVLRTVDLVFRSWAEHLARRGKSDALPLLQPGRRTAKMLIVAVALLATAAGLGFNVTAALAGLGVGGIALALASQKSIENLFGGVSLYTDQPARVGDFCRFGDKMGTVEEIGLRSTRIRTLERSVLTVPNAEFSQLQIDNLSLRDRFLYNPTIGLRYETTPDQIRFVLVEVRRMFYSHPAVHREPARIRFRSFGAYSLDLEVFAYVQASAYDQYLEVAEDLNLRIMDIVEQAGSGFAFPSQTTYLETGSGLDGDAAKAAEAEVAQWRHRGDLALPRFSAQEIERLRGTLDYPPDGSVAAREEAEEGRDGPAV